MVTSEVTVNKKYVGHTLVDNVELEIGGQRIDKHYGDWLEAWSQLTLSEGHRVGYNTMVGDAADANKRVLYVPLQFWFCRNPGLALPLIALQYHEVKVNLTFGTPAAGTLHSASLWCDYIYLDTDERRRFAQVSHEYLIEQLQFTGDESVSAGVNNVRLNFNHPVKELVWVSYNGTEALSKENDYQAMNGNAKLQLNGHDRFAFSKSSSILPKSSTLPTSY